MKCVKDFDFEKFLKENYKLSGKVLTNLYINESTKDLFLSERYLLYNNNLWIALIKIQDYYKLFYSIPTDITVEEKEQLILNFNNLFKDIVGLDIICEYVYKKSPYNLIEEIMQNLCFKPFINRERLRLIKDIDKKYKLTKNPELIVCYASEKSSKEIQYLLESTFDKYTSNLPSESELKQAIVENNVLLIKDKKDSENFMGFIGFSETKGISVIDYFIIKEEYRSKGLSSVLLDYYIQKEVLEKNYRAHLWVQTDNLPAIGLYKKFGYKSEGVYSNSYLRKGERYDSK